MLRLPALPQFQNVRELSAVVVSSHVAVHLDHHFPNLQQLDVVEVTTDVLPELLHSASRIQSLTKISVSSLCPCFPTLSQARCDVVSSLLPVLPITFAGMVEFEGEAKHFCQVGDMLTKMPLLCACVKCVDLPWTWQSVLGGVPQLAQACPNLKTILFLHLELHATPNFNIVDFLSIKVHRPSRNDPGAGIKACKAMLEKMRGWLCRGQGRVCVCWLLRLLSSARKLSKRRSSCRCGSWVIRFLLMCLTVLSRGSQRLDSRLGLQNLGAYAALCPVATGQVVPFTVDGIIIMLSVC